MSNSSKNINLRIEKTKQIIDVIKTSLKEAYGVISLALIENKKGSTEEGVFVRFLNDDCFEVDLYVSVAMDVKITETLRSCQKTVKFYLNHYFPKQCQLIHIYAEDISSK